jgi:hypothetical protein
MCTQRIGGSGLETILFTFVLFLRGLSRRLQFCFLRRKQAKKHLPLGFVAFGLQEMAKAVDIEPCHHLVH